MQLSCFFLAISLLGSNSKSLFHQTIFIKVVVNQHCIQQGKFWTLKPITAFITIFERNNKTRSILMISFEFS